MKTSQIIKAQALLAPYAEMIETVRDENADVSGITVYWRTGGQKLFWSFDLVVDHIEDIKRRRENR